MLAFFSAFALYWFKRYFRNAAETARLAERLQAADYRHVQGGTVRIRVFDLGDSAEISVEDDGVGMEPDTLGRALHQGETFGRKSGVGLANTDRRLKQIFGKGLQVRGGPGQGTIVSFIVPKDSGARNV